MQYPLSSSAKPIVAWQMKHRSHLGILHSTHVPHIMSSIVLCVFVMSPPSPTLASWEAWDCGTPPRDDDEESFEDGLFEDDIDDDSTRWTATADDEEVGVEEEAAAAVLGLFLADRDAGDSSAAAADTAAAAAASSSLLFAPRGLDRRPPPVPLLSLVGLELIILFHT
jgi:hypothetical protein